MGKAGSKSIQKAITSASHQLEIPHLHFSNDLIIIYPDYFYSYEEIINFNSSSSISFIPEVREQISRLLSGLLQASNEDISSERSTTINELITNNDLLQERLVSDLDYITGWFNHRFLRHRCLSTAF
jgi:hypothetical protein